MAALAITFVCILEITPNIFCSRNLVTAILNLCQKTGKFCRSKMSEIQTFYHNSTILITGSTGFLGKLIVEKLLRSCQSVKHIYLIMRNKNGIPASERMAKYFEDPVFSRAKNENSGYNLRVTVIQGDMECDNLNLIPEDKLLLINNVNIIFHVAASVNFVEKLRNAVELNVQACRKVMDLARQMKDLKSYVHVSTVFSNCHLDMVEEKCYPTEVKYDEVIHLLRMHTDDELDKITPKLLGNAPNTYTFTKRLAEQYILDNQGDIPMGIFRPAIVISTFAEPFRGWIDNFYGPIGIIASATAGILHVMCGDVNVFSNVVPADLVVNAILASGWEIAKKREKLPIYNYVSTQNPLNWGQFLQMAKLGLDYPFSNALWYYSLFLIQSRWCYNITRFFIHFLPAFIFDSFLTISNKKRRVLHTYKRIHKMNNILEFFVKKEIRYNNNNVLRLWDEMNEKDKLLFNFDIKVVDWRKYFEKFVWGIREFLLKEDAKSLPDARIRYQRLFWIHQLYKLSFLIMIVFSFYKLFNF